MWKGGRQDEQRGSELFGGFGLIIAVSAVQALHGKVQRMVSVAFVVKGYDKFGSGYSKCGQFQGSSWAEPGNMLEKTLLVGWLLNVPATC